MWKPIELSLNKVEWIAEELGNHFASDPKLKHPSGELYRSLTWRF